MSAPMILSLRELIENNIKKKGTGGNPSHIIKYKNDNIINILVKDETEFYKIYSNIIENDLEAFKEENIKIYEYRSIEFPLVISIKKKTLSKKNIPEDKFITIIKLVRNILVKYLEYGEDCNLLDDNNNLLNCIVMETSKNYNIIFPYFITNYQIQKYIRDSLVETDKIKNKLKTILNIYKNTLYDVFDDKVYDISIYKWLLYGYSENKLIYRFDSDCNKIDCNNYNVYQLLILTSMRSKVKSENKHISNMISARHQDIHKNIQIDKSKLTLKMRNELQIYKNNEYKSHTYFPDKTKGESGDKYYVCDDNLEDFYDLIFNYLNKGIEVHIVERRKEIHPIIIDLDIRQFENTRLYTENTILKFIKLVNNTIKEIYEDIEDDKLQAFILEKKYKKNNPDKNKLHKDGIHIVYPYINISYKVQLYIRHIILTDKYDEMKNIFNFIVQPKEDRNLFEDLYDECIIKHPEKGNGWFIYGCNKPGSNNYDIKFIVNNNNNKIDCKFKTRQLMTLLSMRNKTEINNKIHDNVKEKINDMEIDKPKKKSIKKKISKNITIGEDIEKILNHISNIRINGKPGEEVDINNIIKPLVMECLSKSRADNYQQWIETCWCLYNIHNVGDDMFNVFLEFSKRSEASFDSEEDCRNTWNNNYKNVDRDHKLSIGTLIHWAKKDNLSKYDNIVRNNQKLIVNSIINWDAMNHTAMRTLVYQHLNGFGMDDEVKYVCVKGEKVCKWYFFKNNKWNESEDGDCIRNYLSENNTVKNLFVRELDIAKNQLKDYEANADMKEIIDAQKKKIEKIKKIINNTLCNYNYLKVIENVCRDTFTMDNNKFYNKLDCNPFLIGFNNGVYDLNEMKFRKMKGMDLVTMNTGYDYDKTARNSDEYCEVIHFLKTILPKKEVREYTLILFASFICGIKRSELFLFLKGSGANGKSIFIDIISAALGDYKGNLDVSKLTQKRKPADNADPSISELPNKRVIVSQEPNGLDETMNVGILKEYTGGDEIVIRKLFKAPIKIKPQWSLVMTCNEYVPIDTVDDGTWRRVHVIEFTEKFTDDPALIEKYKNYHPKDPHLKNKIKTWGMAMMQILLEYYIKLKKNDFLINVPNDVLQSTNLYKSGTDTLQTYIDKYLYFNKDYTEPLKPQEINLGYKEWLKNEEIPIPKKFKVQTLKDKIMKWYNEEIATKYNLRTYKNYPPYGLKNISIKTEDQYNADNNEDVELNINHKNNNKNNIENTCENESDNDGFINVSVNTTLSI